MGFAYVWSLYLPFCRLFQQASAAKQVVISLTKCGNFELECTRMRLVAEPCRDPLGTA